MAANVYANAGAASALSRWCSHSRPITHSNNLFSAMGLHHMMSFGCGLLVSRQSVADLIENNHSSRAMKIAINLLFLPIIALYNALLLIMLVLNEVWRITEQTIYVSIFIFTLFILNFTRLNSFYSTAFGAIEKLFGKAWHDSTIVLTTPKRSCQELCKSGECKKGKCYRLVKGYMFDQMYINCGCYKKHLTERIELARERDATKTFFVQSNVLSECKFLWRRSLLDKLAYEPCGVFNDDVLERYYDMDRSMWTNVRLESTARPKLKLATFGITRNALDEVLKVPIDSPDRLFEMPELRYAFLRDRARTEGGKDIVYTPIVLLKRAAMLILAILEVRYAATKFHQEKAVAISIVISTTLYYAISALRDTVTVEDVGGSDSRISRMLAIDALAVGKNLVRYSSASTSWTRHKGYGSAQVGSIDLLENLLYNRAVVMGEKIVSLSREGLDMFIADISTANSSNGSSPRSVDISDSNDSSDNSPMYASNWRKAEVKEVIEASTEEVADLDMRLT